MRTPSKSYVDTLNNTNMNKDLSDLNGLMFEISKLKQLVDISRMIIVVRNLGIVARK